MAWNTAPTLTFTAPNSIKADFPSGSASWGGSRDINQVVNAVVSTENDVSFPLEWNTSVLDFDQYHIGKNAPAHSYTFNNLPMGQTLYFFKWCWTDHGVTVLKGTSSTYTIPYPNHTATLSSNDRFANGTDQIVFTINKSGSSLNTQIRLNGPGASDTVIVASSASTSLTWTVPTSLNASITTKESETYTVKVDTMNGGTIVGTNNYSITVRVPNAAPYLPTATRTLTEQVSAVNTITENAYYVATKSVMRITAGGNAGQNATVTKREILYKLSGVQQTANVTASPYYLELSGATLINVTDIQVRTTDSRGRVDLLSVLSPSIYPYNEPTITTFTVNRCDAGGTLNSSGQYLKTSAVVGAQSIVHASTERNTLQYTITSSPNVANPIRSYGPSSTVTDSWLNNVSGANGYNKNQSYVVTITVTDKFGGSKSSSITIPTELVPLSIGTSGIGVGKIFDTSAGQALDVAGNTRLTGNLNVTGTVTMTVPSHNHAGENITSGTIPEARIPVLTEPKIPSLPASRVTSGVFAAARLPLADDISFGVVERATNAEARTATDGTRYLTPLSAAYMIETISNSNGVAVKFPDGTQICYHTLSVTHTSGTVAQSTWTFPNPFSSAPGGISVIGQAGTTSFNWTSMFSAPTTTSVVIGLLRASNSTTQAWVMAVGRWK